MDFTLYWFMFPVSIAVATCAMLSGIGGAALFTPIFVLVFPLLGPEYVLESTVAAISAALITQTFGFTSGFFGYYRRRLIDTQLAWRIACYSVPVAVLGAFVAGFAPDWLLIAGYAVLVGALSILMLRGGQLAALSESGADAASSMESIVDNDGNRYVYATPRIGLRGKLLTGTGAFLTGLVSVGIGEATISLLTRKKVPHAVAAATSVLVVIATIVFASTTLAVQLVRSGGWTAVPWDLLLYDIPGVLIGGQLGPKLQGRVSQETMRRAIGVLFIVLAVAMLGVARSKFGG